MAQKKIPESFIKALQDKINIVELISRHVKLKKTGQSYIGLCPFHNEKTPSFNVNSQKQFFHCFGCQASGDAIEFVQRYSSVSFVEAIEELAGHAGIPVPYEGGDADNFKPDNRELLNKIYMLLEYSQQNYSEQLYKNEGKGALQYLQKRGLSVEIIKRFNLGFAPNSWTYILNHCAPKYKTEEMVAAGLVVQKNENKIFDRFRNRIIFPIKDRRGRYIGFGGRVMDKSEPKYLNSPETDVFKKGKELFGLYEALSMRTKYSYWVLVEGYMDVIALANKGYTNAVASLGTAVTTEQIELLFRHTSRLYLCFDGDKAGKKAAWRSLELVLPLLREQRQVYFVLLPSGEDPDSIISKRGPKGWDACIEEALPLSQFLFGGLTKGLRLDLIEDRAILTTKARDLISRIPEKIIQGLMIQKLRELTGVDFEKKKNLAPQTTQAPMVRSNFVQVRAGAKVLPAPLRVLALVMHNPSLILQIEDIPEIEVISDVLGISTLINLKKNNTQKEDVSNQIMSSPESLNIAVMSKWAGSLPDNCKNSELSAAVEALSRLIYQKKITNLLEKLRVNGLNEQEKVELRDLISQG